MKKGLVIRTNTGLALRLRTTIPYCSLKRNKLLRKHIFGFVARFLSGETVEIVLSGGAARATAEQGALKRIQELRIPIDSVSGVSMGAYIGGSLW